MPAYASSSIAPVLGFGLYAILARAHNSTTLTNGVAFAALTLFSLLDKPMTALVDGGEEIMTVVNSFSRIQKHLLEPEREDYRQFTRRSTSNLSQYHGEEDRDGMVALDRLKKPFEDDGVCVSVKDVSAGWSSEGPPQLKELNFDIMSGKTTMIVGPVGCGKTTLLKLLIGELPEVSGSIFTTFSNASYCSQSPWITFGTIQQNILCTALWDKPWYDAVITACSLQRDFQDFPDGDQTKVGTRGSRLSGGQQIRVVCSIYIYA